MKTKTLTMILFLIVVGIASAQTTTNWVMVSPASCQSNFTHPTSFYEFSCNINFVIQNPDGTTGPDTGEMIGTNVINFNPTGFDITGGTPYLSKKSKVLKDVAPANGQPGQATWEWQVQTQDGMYHVGVLTMQWEDVACGRSGCQVKVLQSQTTVDVSTVAILD